jgi:hypothetical protein
MTYAYTFNVECTREEYNRNLHLLLNFWASTHFEDTNTLVLCSECCNHATAYSLGHYLAVLFKQDATAFVQRSEDTGMWIGRHFAGPRTIGWVWDDTKFRKLDGHFLRDPEPAPVPEIKGGFQSLMVIPYGNDTPIRWCLWDSANDVYLGHGGTRKGEPLTFASAEVAEHNRTAAQAVSWPEWTKTRPASK